MRDDSVVDDPRATDPVERLLEDSWAARGRRTSVRELAAESAAAVAFLAVAVPLAVAATRRHGIDPGEAAVLVGLYAVVSRMLKFPLGAGYVVPSYLVLVPMLVLLPAGVVPLLAAAGLALGTAAQCAVGQARPERVLFSIPDAWHAIGPAVVLMVAEPHASGPLAGLVYLAAFAAACAVDLLSSALREAGALGISPKLQLRVVAVVWLVDAGVAPVGYLVARAAGQDALLALLILPMAVLLLFLVRDRNARIEQAQHHLDLVARERTRLQAAVARLGDAFAAKLDLDALMEILLRGSVEALGADAGRLVLRGGDAPCAIRIGDGPRHEAALDAAAATAERARGAAQAQNDGVWAVALPLGFQTGGGTTRGALTVARADRRFRDDEVAVISRLVERARDAAAEIADHHALRDQAVRDALTGLGNRRKLVADLTQRLQGASPAAPLVLVLFDLDGFKTYNDTFGHPAGDALLTRLASRLASALAGRGEAYRLGGDEFCVLLDVPADDLQPALSAAALALEEHGEGFAIGASCGAVMLPHEAVAPDYALQLADARMYSHKHGRESAAGRQTRDVLMHIMQAKQPTLDEHASEVSHLAVRVGRRLGMTEEELDETARAAELHDVGKVGVPDAILNKPGPLDPAEWEFMYQHTLLGERILSAAPALRPVAVLVRASHERWDGLGYPDGLAGDEIPLGARIVAVCDAYEAMTADRCYRRAMSPASACLELRREAGRQFDPRVVAAFLAEVRPAAEAGVPDPAPEPDERLARVERVAAHLRAVLDQGAAPGPGLAPPAAGVGGARHDR